MIHTCYLIAAADPKPFQWTVYARAWGRADRAIKTCLSEREAEQFIDQLGATNMFKYAEESLA